MDYCIIYLHILAFFCFHNDSATAFESNITSNCTVLRNSFANASSQFTMCAIYHSRPITMCENCVESYINVLNSYSNLSKFSDDGIKCIDYLIDLDRLQVVETLYLSSYNLWNRAKCYECFQVINGTLTPNKSNETEEFNRLHQNLMQCLNRSDITNDTLCPECMSSYVDLNTYFLSISNANEKIGVCMDIVDTMNNTWIFWGTTCCKFRRHDETIFIGITVLIFIITILFYVITQWFVEKKTPTIAQQTRFAESVHNINT